MELETILKIVSIVLGVISSTIIPLVIKLISVIKARKAAKNDAEREAATNEMLDYVNTLIITAEDLYKGIDQIMKANGKTTGSLKLDSVLTKLQAFAIDNGYEFDNEYWTKKVNEIIDLTKKVN